MWPVDHCHETGQVRGLLCNLCNQALGLFKDSPELLARATAYLHNPPYSQRMAPALMSK